MDQERFEYVRRRPAVPLRPYVAWYSGYRQTGGQPGRHRGLPSPYLTLIVTLDDPLEVAVPSDPREAPGTYSTLLGGLHQVPTIIAHPGRQSGIQLALEPLGARALFGLPAGELANHDLPAAAVLGGLADELHERVQLAGDWSARFAAVDWALLRRLDCDGEAPPDLLEAWSTLKSASGAVRVADLATATGWSSRYLTDRFRTEIGLTPKAAARVIRFDRARRDLQRRAGDGNPGSLADLAAAWGYYDQAHLAREFREIAGCSASQWLKEEFRNFQALDSDDFTD